MDQLLPRQQFHSVLVHLRLQPRSLKRANHLEGLVHLKHLPSIHPSALVRMKADQLPLSHLGKHPRQLRTRLLRFLLVYRQIPTQIHSRPLQARHLVVPPHLLNQHPSPLVRQVLLQVALRLDLNPPRLLVEETLLFLNPPSQRQLLGAGLVSAKLLLPLPHSLLLFPWLNQRLLEGHYSQLVLHQLVRGRLRSCLAGATSSGSAAST